MVAHSHPRVLLQVALLKTSLGNVQRERDLANSQFKNRIMQLEASLAKKRSAREKVSPWLSGALFVLFLMALFRCRT